MTIATVLYVNRLGTSGMLTLLSLDCEQFIRKAASEEDFNQTSNMFILVDCNAACLPVCFSFVLILHQLNAPDLAERIVELANKGGQ